MKSTPVIILASLLSACVTPAQSSKDAAWAECEKLVDRASRSACMTNALSQANADRRAKEAADDKAHLEQTRAIEDKAAIDQAHGVPTGETGTRIVREPFESSYFVN